MCKYLRWDYPIRHLFSLHRDSKRRQKLQRAYNQAIDAPGQHVKVVTATEEEMTIVLKVAL